MLVKLTLLREPLRAVDRSIIMLNFHTRLTSKALAMLDPIYLAQALVTCRCVTLVVLHVGMQKRE